MNIRNMLCNNISRIHASISLFRKEDKDFEENSLRDTALVVYGSLYCDFDKVRVWWSSKMYDVDYKRRSSGSTGRHNFGPFYPKIAIGRILLMTRRLTHVWFNGVKNMGNWESVYVRDLRGESMRRASNETWRAGIIGSETKNEERCKLCNMLINFQRTRSWLKSGFNREWEIFNLTDLKFTWMYHLFRREFAGIAI
jgi:hypothetical protein